MEEDYEANLVITRFLSTSNIEELNSTKISVVKEKFEVIASILLKQEPYLSGFCVVKLEQLFDEIDS